MARAVFLSSLCLMIYATVSAVSSAEKSVFVQTGKSIKLEFSTKDQQQFDMAAWVFNETENIVRYYMETKSTRTSPEYIRRVEFDNETFALTLQHLQKTDSGLYVAKTTGHKNFIVAQYKISVVDPVETPVLTVIVNWSHRDSCNVTCKGHDLSLTSSCNSSSCSEEKVTSSQGSVISLSVTESFVTCNYSNQASWKTNKKDLCTLHEGVTGAVNGKNTSVYGVIFILAIVIIAAVTVTILRKKKTQSHITDFNQPDNSVYAMIEDTHAVKETLERPDEDPASVYSTVGEPSQPATENQQTTSKPETVYALVDEA